MTKREKERIQKQVESIEWILSNTHPLDDDSVNWYVGAVEALKWVLEHAE